MRPTAERTVYLMLHHNPRANHGKELSARLSMTPPSLQSGEIAIALHLRVPTALFKKPQLEATVAVPDATVPPQEIPVDFPETVRALVADQLGVDLNITVTGAADQ